MLARVLLIVLAVAATAAGDDVQDRWHLPDWPWRHVVEIVSPDPSGAINTALATVDTGGRCQPDGRDVRVVEAASGKAVPHKARSVERGVATLEFLAPDPRCLRYHVYYGNDKAPAETHEWERKLGGLTLETWHNTQKQPGRGVDHVRQLIKASQKKFGEGPRRAIDDVTNPFGASAEDQDFYLSRYAGKLFCREDGNYLFVTNSDDSSFLLVDGKLAGQVAGGSTPTNDFDPGRGRGGVMRLTKGIHEIEYLHVELTGDQLARAGWRPPWSKQIRAIPEDAFIRELRTATLARQGRDQGVSAYFGYQIVDAAQFAGLESAFVTVAFKQRASWRFDKPVVWEWDFGDGSTSREENPKRLFVKEGVLKVTLRCVDAMGYHDTCVREVAVEAKDPVRIKAALETRSERPVLKPDEQARLSTRYMCTGSEPWECSLVAETLDQGRVTSRTRKTVTLKPNVWQTEERTLSGPARLSLEFCGMTLVREEVVVAAPESVTSELREINGGLVDEAGRLVVLRLSREVQAASAEGAVRLLRAGKQVKICVMDDSLAPRESAESPSTYYAILARELARRYPNARINARRIGGEFVSHHDPLRRLGRLPALAAQEKPDVVIVAASMRDLTNGVPAEQHEVCLYALADRLRGVTRADVILVTPPPLIINPDLSKQYAERTMRAGLRRGLKVADVYSSFARMGEEGWRKLFQDPQEPDVLYLYPNAEGQERIAEVLLRVVLEQK